MSLDFKPISFRAQLGTVNVQFSDFTAGMDHYDHAIWPHQSFSLN